MTEALEEEISDLRQLLKDKEIELQRLRNESMKSETKTSEDKLSNDEIARFSRQIIMPEIGVKGQLCLKNSSVLIVGVGGLGCPSALYLVGAGVGHIGLVDYDDVEVNNLHRQLLHTEDNVGLPKVLSAKESLRRLHSNAKITIHHMQLDSSNARALVQQYDVVVDATDNVATRYLLNDSCVMSGKPLVSGSALQLEGQLTVYNYKGGPCYRCLFPVPPLPETVTNCGDGGVLGAVPGVIGVLQALETIKILLGHPGVLSRRMLVFDGSETSFRNIRLRGRNASCDVCGDKPMVTKLIDYEQFCGARANDKVEQLAISEYLLDKNARCQTGHLASKSVSGVEVDVAEQAVEEEDSRVHLLGQEDRISPKDYSDASTQPHITIDVRSPMEFEICSLPDSMNIPLKELTSDPVISKLKETVRAKTNVSRDFPVYVVCRRGNDSQKGVLMLKEKLGPGVVIKDIEGGLHKWARDVDQSFPVY